MLDLKETEKLEKFITQAKQAGMPKDQVQRCLAAGYVPLHKMMRFHAASRQADHPEGPKWIACGGARGPGKSHATLSQSGLDDCQRVDELKFLFLRKVKKAAKESFEDLIRRVFRNVPIEYSTYSGKLEFPNGSWMILGGYKNESDIDNYLGIEYDGMVIEEATTLSYKKIKMIEGSLRTSKTEWRPRIYMSTNPGGIGHGWFKEYLVMPMRTNSEKDTRFIFSNYKDNPFLNKEYVEYLEGLEGDLGRAWRDGDFDVFEGQALSAWNNEEHVIEPFDIPHEWPKWRGTDGGYRAPYCTVWLTRNPHNGRIYVYREHYQALLTDRTQARMIKEYTPPDENVMLHYADPALWARKNIGGKVISTYEEYKSEGIFLTKGDNDRLGGKRRIDRLLEPLEDGEPGIQFFSTCANLVRTLPALSYSETQPEDVDTNGEDHGYDALRYALTNYQIPGEPVKSDMVFARNDMTKFAIL